MTPRIGTCNTLPVRPPRLKSLAVLSLATWFLSGVVGQLLWLHVGEAHGAHHAHEATPISVAICDADHEHHDHQIPEALSLPFLPGVRHNTHATPVAVLSAPRQIDAGVTAGPLTPDSQPRGKPLSPHRIAILQI